MTNNYNIAKKKDVSLKSDSSLSPRDEVQMDLIEGVKETYEVADSSKSFWERMQEKADYLQSNDDYYESLKDTDSPPNDEQIKEDESLQRFTKMPTAQYRARRLKRLLADDSSEYQRIMHLPPVARMNTINKMTETSNKEWADRWNGIAKDEDEYENYYYKVKPMVQEVSTLNPPQPIKQSSTQQTKLIAPKETTSREPDLSKAANASMTHELADTNSPHQSNAYSSNILQNNHRSSKKEQIDKITSQTTQFKALYREGEEEEYNRIFDLYTTGNQEYRKENYQQRQERITRQINEIAKVAERKTGYLSTEEEAKMVKKSLVAVQYEKDGPFVEITNSFDPQKDDFYMLKLDTRLLFGDSAQERANEMVDLLYRLRMKEGDAQDILDMTDKKERLRRIKEITKNHRYDNTPIALPTSGLPANVIRYASPAYLKATPEERLKMANHFGDAPNVHADMSNPFLLIKNTPNQIAGYATNATVRKTQGYDIEVPINTPLDIDYNASPDQLMLYGINQSIHGGSADWGLPEFRNEKGEIIDFKKNRVEYARAARAYMNSSLQAILHETYHSRTNAPLHWEQTQHIDNDTGENIIHNKILSKVPGVAENIHASNVPEILNAVHALKRYIRQHFPEETLQSVDDFDFLYHNLWRPDDKSAEVARIRSTIPRDARILFTVYSYMIQQEKIKSDAQNYFNRNRAFIQKKHPELKKLDDLFRQMHSYKKILRIDPQNKKGQINDSLYEIM